MPTLFGQQHSQTAKQLDRQTATRPREQIFIQTPGHMAVQTFNRIARPQKRRPATWPNGHIVDHMSHIQPANQKATRKPLGNPNSQKGTQFVKQLIGQPA